jgi:cell division protein FtsW (lipid II flippase)
MHGHNDKNSSKMMWVMMIGCVLPMVLLLFLGTGKGFGSSSWIALGAVGLMFVIHLFMMIPRKNTHEEHKMNENNKDNNTGNKNHSSGHGCCH